MPTKHQRIPVTNDPELADALVRVSRHFPGVPAARVVHDLAVKGAATIEREQADREEAIERLIAWSTRQEEGGIDWDVLERIEETWRLS